MWTRPWSAPSSQGATIKKPVADQFYGDRTGTIEDPWGHKWTVAVHLEDVSPEEMQRRMAAHDQKVGGTR